MQNFYKINILGLQFLGLFHRLHLPKKYSSQQDSEVFPIEMIEAGLDNSSALGA